MRIISQNGTIDVPYEQVVIQRYKEKIYFLNKNLTGVEHLTDDMEIASYSTEAKAKKAMEMLREKYERYEISCSEYPVNWFDFPKVFRLPADEDVEV